MKLETARNWAMAVVTVALAAVVLGMPADAADPLAGSQGVDTALPTTDSQLTASGRGKFSDLKITVNQTKNLTNQAISVVWEGGKRTQQGPGQFASNYLQIFQCWGDDDGTEPANPGPPPEQCVQGAVGGTYEGRGGGLFVNEIAIGRAISSANWANFDPADGFLDSRTGTVWRPFRAVDGTVVNVPVDPTFEPSRPAGNYWLNPFFNQVTTNEIAAGITRADGTGSELVQVLTGVESSGLGCGQRVKPGQGQEREIPQCWLVVVPRGTPADENVGTPFEVAADQNGVATSPLSSAVWKQRIAIPLEFNPVDTACRIGADERRIVGNEQALGALTSWQPGLCGIGDLPPFSYIPVPDSSARQQLTSDVNGGPGMAVVSLPLPSSSTSPTNPVVYAPLTLSGLVVGFNLERVPALDAPAEARAIAGVRVSEMNLTPRLVAKLLTQSYRRQTGIGGNPPYAWATANPEHVGVDPDFVRFNPEFAQLGIGDSRTFGGLQLPAGNSDAAQQVWEWILSDPEARAWLDGAPDEWGMAVNPAYAAVASANSAGIAFGDPVPNSFPKGDPYCFQAPPAGSGGRIIPPPLCGTDWMPYARSFADAARVARIGADSARIEANPFVVSESDYWRRTSPQLIGRRSMLALTDTPSAAQYGLQTARLSAAGDNRADREFIAADEDRLQGGVAARVSVTNGGFPPVDLGAAPLVAPYPLTTLTYAAITPLTLTPDERSDYAAFLDYASGAGQEPGLELGQLPRGYVRLPGPLLEQSRTAAATVRTLQAVVPAQPAAPVPAQPAAPPPVAPPEVSPLPPVPVATTGPAPAQTPARRSATPGTPPVSEDVTVEESVPSSTEPVRVEPVVSDPPQAAAPPPSQSTPAVQSGAVRLAVPGVGALALGSLLGALELTKRPRRSSAMRLAKADGGA